MPCVSVLNGCECVFECVHPGSWRGFPPLVGFRVGPSNFKFLHKFRGAATEIDRTRAREKRLLCASGSPACPQRGPTAMLLIDLPDELLVHCALQCVMHDHVISAQQLSHGCKHLHELFLLVRSDIASRRHTLRWIVPRLAGDVVLRGGGRGLRASSDGCWKRAYGRQLIPHGCSSWSVRIDRCKGSQGLLQIGVVLVQRTLTCEWSVSPFYGRLIRRTWDRDGTMLLGAVPPDGHPDGHLKHMLVDGQGEPVRLEGSANGRIIEVLCDHVAGTLAFALDGAPPGPALEGFPRLSDGGGALLRPVRLIASDCF